VVDESGSLEHVVVVFVVTAESDLSSKNQTIRKEDLRCRINPYLQTTSAALTDARCQISSVKCVAIEI